MDDYILPKEISKIDLSLIDTIDDETIVINAKNGNLEIVDLLIKKGLDIHITAFFKKMFIFHENVFHEKIILNSYKIFYFL